jgi:hypothetical protein
MHDLRCVEPDEMYYETLAERTRYFEEGERGKEDRCKIWEEVRDEGAEKAKIEAAQERFTMGVLTPVLVEKV